jgi:hypothetical protein
MTAAESAGEAPMLPWMIDVVVGIVTAGIVSDPFIVRVNVGSFGMSRLVRKPAVFWSGRLLVPGRALRSRGSRTVCRNVSAANAATAATMLPATPALRPGRNTEHKDERETKSASQ